MLFLPLSAIPPFFTTLGLSLALWTLSTIPDGKAQQAANQISATCSRGQRGAFHPLLLPAGGLHPRKMILDCFMIYEGNRTTAGLSLRS